MRSEVRFRVLTANIKALHGVLREAVTAGVATGWTVWDSSPENVERFFFSPVIQNGSEAHLGSFPGAKRQEREGDYLSSYKRVEPCLHSSYVPTWRRDGQLYFLPLLFPIEHYVLWSNADRMVCIYQTKRRHKPQNHRNSNTVNKQVVFYIWAFFLCFWRNSPTRAKAASFIRFLDHRVTHHSQWDSSRRGIGPS